MAGNGRSVMTQPDYIEQRDNGYWILGTRVSLDSVVYRFLEGLSPETIQAACFPTLTLDQVYGAISYYLTNRVEIDRYLRDSHEDYEALRQRTRAEYPEAHRRLDGILEEARTTGLSH
jgi:uncharacterized protein (DUF433 family)